MRRPKYIDIPAYIFLIRCLLESREFQTGGGEFPVSCIVGCIRGIPADGAGFASLFGWSTEAAVIKVESNRKQ